MGILVLAVQVVHRPFERVLIGNIVFVVLNLQLDVLLTSPCLIRKRLKNGEMLLGLAALNIV
jgi:hypothetical protein